MSEADTLAPRNPIFKTEINGCIIDFDVKCRNSSFSSFLKINQYMIYLNVADDFVGCYLQPVAGYGTFNSLEQTGHDDRWQVNRIGTIPDQVCATYG